LRQISRSSELSFCKEVLFVHRVWRLFAIVIFILTDSRTLSRALLVCGLQATPESLASQCLLAAYLLRQGLIPVFSGRLLFLSSVSRVLSKSVSEPDEPCCLSYVRTTTRQPQVRLQPLSLWLDSASRLLRRTPMNGCFRWPNRPGDSSLGSVANLFPHGNLSPIGLFLNGFGPETPGLLWSAVYP
jgi:hypothetical protein